MCKELTLASVQPRVCERGQGNSSAELARTKDEYDAFLADPANLARVAAAEGGGASEEQAKVLSVLRRTFATYIAEDERVTAIKASLRAEAAQGSFIGSNLGVP